MKPPGLGVDIEQIKRFKILSKRNNNRFLKNNFSKIELDYCFSFNDSATHLAGTFAAKEAIFKSIGKNILLSEIEVRREKNGNPTVWIKDLRQSKIIVSISHTKNLALAIAIKNE